MNNMIDVSYLIDDFTEAESHYILAKLGRTFQVSAEDHYYLQCILFPLSDEPDIIQENESLFWNKSKVEGKIGYAVTGEFLCHALAPEYEKSYTKEEVEEQERKIRELLKDKILLFKPFYKYDGMKNLFYKNLDYNGEIQIFDACFEYETFFSIPVLSEQNYKLFKNHKTFTLSNWNFTLFGQPQYLLYQNHLITAKLSQTELSDYNCVFKEEDSDSYLELEFDKDGFSQRHLFISIQEMFGYVFLEKSLLPLMSVISEPSINKQDDNDDGGIETQENGNDTSKALLQFEEYIKSKNLYYYDEDIKNFHACLKSGLLTILAGMSGTGKTRLPLEYAHFFNMSEENHTLLFVPISPSYSEPSDMLGFYNPSKEAYVPSETGLVSFLKHASEKKDMMHMVVFDEMNLSQIEFYFAPFLSIMERDINRRFLSLYDENLPCINKEAYPAHLPLFDNVLFVGTINLDETTKELSDRLLDRSFVISLRKATFDKYNAVMADKKENPVPCYEKDLMSLMPRRNQSFDFNSVLTPKMREFFDEFNKLISTVDPQKGVSFRTVRNIALYLSNARIEEVDEEDISSKQAFDYAVRQTILRKIKGSSDVLREIIGIKDEKGNVQSKLKDLFDRYQEISSFELCRQDLSDKILELDKYGYAR